MSEAFQPSIFDSSDTRKPKGDAFVLAQKAVRIAAAAGNKPVEYANRTSEAALDQGKGYVDQPVEPAAPEVETGTFLADVRGKLAAQPTVLPSPVAERNQQRIQAFRDRLQ